MTRPKIPFSQKARRTGEQPISPLMREALANPALISLAAGFVDQASLPTSETARVLADLLADPSEGKAALQYGTTRGLQPLRAALLRQFEQLEGRSAASLNLTAENILVTTGSQQGLYLLGTVLLDPGDIVIASAPDYFVYTSALASFGADIRTVEMDAEGMRIDRVAELLDALEADGQIQRVKAVYVVSYYQNPTGLNLSAERREQLYELVRTRSRSHRIVILEDAAYRELRYDGPAHPSIKSYDTENLYVAYAMTFSKSLSPGMKTGWFVVPEDLLEAMVHEKGNHDFGSANLTQHALRRILENGLHDRHVRGLCAMYRAKRDAMLSALERTLGDLPVTWTKPDGGLYVWVTFPEEIDTRRGQRLFQRCVASGVLYVPGDYCFAPQGSEPVPTNHMRLSFGVVDVPTIEKGVNRLADAVREELAACQGPLTPSRNLA